MLVGVPLLYLSFSISDIEGALIIADGEEMTMNNMTLDYLINDDGTCTCKLCGEVTASRTHWYRHKYKVNKIEFKLKLGFS